MRKIDYKIMQQFIAQKNVAGIGLGLKKCPRTNHNRKALVVFVNKKDDKDSLSSQLLVQEVGGYLVDIVEVGDIRLMRKSMLRPAPPGCSIGHFRISAGTLGAIVKDRVSQDILILSNNHVLANTTDGQDGKAQVGDYILQPGVSDGGKMPRHILARLWRFVPIWKERPLQGSCLLKGFKHCISCFRNRFSCLAGGSLPNSGQNLVDAAVARPLSAGSVSPYALGLGMVNGSAEARVGEALYFSGRTSGVRKGNVLAVGSTFRIKIGADSYAVFADQIVTEGISNPGDSGALAVNGQKQAVGLLFAGSRQATLFNRIQNVFEALQVDLVK